MGILLDFASAARATRSHPPARLSRIARRDRPADIIFFPGVRYEREALELAARIGTIRSGAGPAPQEQG
ncbi:hypothetical protein [Roseibium aestuarii]|uniref:Uncharacterized protein n=1 Tax=Roseibium aestuarii TaxID=2600299 RepID=A0ABW4JS10_9HYPH|nr:hypothetical protein [Roseibium aestuarii]